MAKEKIRHSGVIQSISGSCAEVLISRCDACSICSEPNRCKVSGAVSSVIQVSDRSVRGRRVGERVIVETSLTNGLRAVGIAYLFPLLVLMTVVAFVYGISSNESLAALGGIVSVVLCYGGLYLWRSHLYTTFLFKLSDNSDDE